MENGHNYASAAETVDRLSSRVMLEERREAVEALKNEMFKRAVNAAFVDGAENEFGGASATYDEFTKVLAEDDSIKKTINILRKQFLLGESQKYDSGRLALSDWFDEELRKPGRLLADEKEPYILKPIHYEHIKDPYINFQIFPKPDDQKKPPTGLPQTVIESSYKLPIRERKESWTLPDRIDTKFNVADRDKWADYGFPTKLGLVDDAPESMLATLLTKFKEESAAERAKFAEKLLQPSKLNPDQDYILPFEVRDDHGDLR